MSPKRVRVTVLLILLAGTALWATRILKTRHARNDWVFTLEVHVAVLSPDAVSAETQAAAKRSVSLAEAFLNREFSRYQPDGIPTAVRLTMDPPVTSEAPHVPETTWERFQLERKLHALAVEAHPGVNADGTLFIVLTESEGESVEGLGASGGDVGWVQSARAQVDSVLAQEALAHELLHLVGAKDHYDASGHPQAPDGLANPDQVPLYPQTHAEVMAEELATGPGQGRVPNSLSEVQVGPVTAREVHWRL